MDASYADIGAGFDFSELQRQLAMLSMLPNTMQNMVSSGGMAPGGALGIPQENDRIAAYWDQMCRQQQLLSTASMLVNNEQQGYGADPLLPALASLSLGQGAQLDTPLKSLLEHSLRDQILPLKKGSQNEKRKKQSKKKNEQEGKLFSQQDLEDFKRGFGQRAPTPLIDRFRKVKGRGFILEDVFGQLVAFAVDQTGSRFLQVTLPNAKKDDFNRAFDELLPHADTLIVHVFGNYVLQKLLERGSFQQRNKLSKCIQGRVMRFTMQVYGCRVVQKAMDYLDVAILVDLAQELKGNVINCTLDLNGNHVIQKCIERLPENKIEFILVDIMKEIRMLTTHQYGCRVLQRIMERPNYTKHKGRIAEVALTNIVELSKNPYGNYVVQHVLEYGAIEDRSNVIASLVPHIDELSRHKFASNVVEKCLLLGGPAERRALLRIILGKSEQDQKENQRNGSERLLWQDLIIDQFGNYVIQRVLEVMSKEDREELLLEIGDYLRSLKGVVYGEHVFKRVEKVLGYPTPTLTAITHLGRA